MNTPKVILLSRRDLATQLDAVKKFTELYPITMAVAVSPEDAQEALKLTPAVAGFQQLTALVADFPASLIINEDGSIEPLELAGEQSEETPLITLAE